MRFVEESCIGMRFFNGVCLSVCVMDDATAAYLLIGVVTRSFLMLLSFFFFFWQRVARFNGLKVTPVFKRGPTSSLALRMVASRRCHPLHISAAVSNIFSASPTVDLSFIFSDLAPKDSSHLIRVDLLWRARFVRQTDS